MIRTRAILAAIACAALAAGCSDAPAESARDALTATADAAAAVTSAPAPVGDERGALIGDQPLAETAAVSPNGPVTARELVYRSTSGLDGSGTEVSGTVFVPPGAAPDGGWPIVTVGHGTTGVTDECAPSRYPDLLGAVGMVTALLERGYVVVASDYQGLGTPGPHPYLEPKSAAHNLIDGVRAARAAVPNTSNRWAALGLSQGGQASWSAAEHAAGYGDGLEFVGAAHLSPAADLSHIADDLGGIRLTLPQQIFLPMLLAGSEAQHAGLDPANYIRGALADSREALMSCGPRAAERKWDAAVRITRADSLPLTSADTDRMRAWLERIALPQHRTEAPMLVVVGESDDLIPADWTRVAVTKACALGDVIALESRPGEGHADARANPGAVAWIADRFAGVPAPNTCPGTP
ncbi:lipase family protein [Rhodococcus sp. UNC363MFTsu5.1]|uniref:lipase family protein n=1 Tax=Rhodococcus sp. UNC363MFTsu5.1 TaxID=1449069 RepID=UPI00055A5363|nr:lipase family protein [Rhodococcus sp. UNC363MFTsu5.1]